MCDNYAFAVAASVYGNSWFSTEGLCNAVKTNRGSGAGTPLADIIFALAMSRILSLLRDQLEAGSFSASLGNGRHRSIPFYDISYHDDLVIPCVAPAPELVSISISGKRVLVCCTYRGVE